MVSAPRTAKSCDMVQGDVSSDNSGKDYDPEKEGSDSVTDDGPKARASGTATWRGKGKRPGKRRSKGELSMLPEMPLDILCEVSSRTNPVTNNGI